MSHLINVVLAAGAKDPAVAVLLFFSTLFVAACVAIAGLHLLRLLIGIAFVPSDSTAPEER
jgi:hypothetical protein